MAYRFYIVPIEIWENPNGGTYRGPKYFHWRWAHMCDPVEAIPGLEDVPYNNLHYGADNIMIVCTDVNTTQHNLLVAKSDVMALPLDIDQTLTAGAVTIAQDFLEPFFIPAHWVTTSLTYRQVLRVIAGMFMFAQRLDGISREKIRDLGITLNTQWETLPTPAKNKLKAAADSLGLDSSGVTQNTTIRQMLKILADQFDDWNYKLGGYTL